jgi:hypothetical protein
MMSLCQSWFGRDLSKNRGLGGFFAGLDLVFCVNPSPFSNNIIHIYIILDTLVP